VGVAKVFARIAVMAVAVRVWQPLITRVTALEMMRLMKTLFVNGLSGALQAHKKHGSNQQIEDPDTHSADRTRIQLRLTDAVHRFAHGQNRCANL